LKHLDVGAGWGHLIQRLHAACPALQSDGCDYNPDHNHMSGIPITHVNLNQEKLPYSDASYDLVTCTEVIEHVENFRTVVKEIGRVTKPRGLAFITTPNVLSVRSRLRYLFRGFYEFFDPFPLAGDPSHYPGERHMTPIPFFYLAHALLESGFQDIAPSCDKSSVFHEYCTPLWLPYPLGCRSQLEAATEKV